MSKINMTISGGKSALDMQMSPKNNGSGTSTSNYPDLENKPQINGTELVGNKTAKELGLVDEATLKLLEGIVAKKLNDILVGGTSIVENGVANIPHNAISDYFGTERTPSTYSIANDWTPFYISNGILNVREANDAYISNRTNESNRAVLTSNKVDSIVRTAMCDGKGPEWTVPEKASARDRLGCEWRYIGKVQTSEDVARMTMTLDENGQPFNLRKVRIVAVNYPNTNDLGGWIRFSFNDVLIQNDCSDLFGGIKSTDKQRICDIEVEKIGTHLRFNTVFTSINSTNVCHLVGSPVGVLASYNFNNTHFDGCINKIDMYSYQNAIGAGAYFEVWGVDA